MNHEEFLKDQLLKLLQKHFGEGIVMSELNFVIIPSDVDNEKARNSRDDLINKWILPTTTDIKLALNETVNVLSFGEALMPLWVRVKKQEEKVFLLNISRRFRKLRDIREYHKGNEFMPFIYDDHMSLAYSEETERNGLIRKLLWRFNLNETEKETFIKRPLTRVEINTFFIDHFKGYIYFPPDYNHRKPGEKGYNKLAIRRESENEFSLIDDIETSEQKSLKTFVNIEAAVEYYLDKEKNNIIDGIKIEG
jgi:hypothetical protein